MTGRSAPAVLLGIDRLLGLQLARILWQHGIPVIGVAFDSKSHYCRTRAVQQVFATDALLREPMQFMESLAREFSARPVVIPCMDEFVFWLNDNRDSVSVHADFLLPESDALELLGDKSRFYRHGIEHDLPLPTTHFVQTRAELEAAAQDLGFPLMIKPPRRSPEWMSATGGFKVLRVDAPEQLEREIAPLLALEDELILQAWIEGGDDCMYSLFVCFDRASRPAIPSLVARKLRQWPPDIGVGSLVAQVDEDELAERGLRILRELEWIGTGSLQFKRDAESGEFFIIEMNTRFALNFPLCEASGVEATLTHYQLAAGLPLSSNRTILHPGSKWICWKRDVASAFAHWRRGDLTFGQWLSSLRGRKRSAEFLLTDPLPTFIDVGRKLRKGLSGSARRTLAGR